LANCDHFSWCALRALNLPNDAQLVIGAAPPIGLTVRKKILPHTASRKGSFTSPGQFFRDPRVRKPMTFRGMMRIVDVFVAAFQCDPARQQENANLPSRVRFRPFL
jgi:hypothetical protein